MLTVSPLPCLHYIQHSFCGTGNPMPSKWILPTIHKHTQWPQQHVPLMRLSQEPPSRHLHCTKVSSPYWGASGKHRKEMQGSGTPIRNVIYLQLQRKEKRKSSRWRLTLLNVTGMSLKISFHWLVADPVCASLVTDTKSKEYIYIYIYIYMYIYRYVYVYIYI